MIDKEKLNKICKIYNECERGLKRENLSGYSISFLCEDENFIVINVSSDIDYNSGLIHVIVFSGCYYFRNYIKTSSGFETFEYVISKNRIDE
jgi:hypothetical protein